MKLKACISALLVACLLFAQTQTGGLTPKGVVDMSGATSVTYKSGSIPSAALNITTTTCTNQFFTALSATAIGTCTTDTLASAQHANQGTTTTLLHGNASGNPSWSSIALADVAAGPLRIKPWTVIIGDPGAGSPVLANDNDSPVSVNNDLTTDITITAVACWADAGSPTITPILTGGTSTSILTGALTCGTASWAAGTVNGSPVLHTFSANGSTCSSTPCSADVNITTAGGTAKYIVVKLIGTY